MTGVLQPADARRPAWSGHAIAALLELDPDLGRGLPPAQFETARRELQLRVINVEPGPCRLDAATSGDDGWLGLLVVDGLLARELLAHDVASMELLGPGDLLRPWDEAADSELLEAVVRWSALARTRFAVLDLHVALRLARYPQIHCALLERCAWRSRRLAVLQAISQLNRVDQRVLALLWHLAERWGRVTPDGIAVPLALSHRMLGQLVGARRPTISSAFAQLARAGEVMRGPDGTWLLTGSPVGRPDAKTANFVAPRRRMLPPSAEPVAV
jgi:CRP/FNR family transcriptional regulator, cyclic AMP receptor protein